VSCEVVKTKGDMCTDVFEVSDEGEAGDDKNVGRGTGRRLYAPKPFVRFGRCVWATNRVRYVSWMSPTSPSWMPWTGSITSSISSITAVADRSSVPNSQSKWGSQDHQKRAHQFLDFWILLVHVPLRYW
jgi:hypothetical protein